MSRGFRLTAGMAVVTAICAAGGCVITETKNGSPIPVQPLPSAIPGERTTVTGTIVIQDNGCIDLDLGEAGQRWIVWPYDVVVSGVGPLTEIAVQVQGHDLVEGDQISGTGALLEAADLPKDDSDLVSLSGGCDADDLGVVVLDDVSLVTGSS